MTLGSRRPAGTSARLREVAVPAPVHGPLGPLSNLKVTAKIRAKVKARAPLAAQVEDPTAAPRGQRHVQSLSASSPTFVEPDQHRLASEAATNISSSSSGGGRGRSHTTSSALTTASSSSSIPTITVTETRINFPAQEDPRQSASSVESERIEAEAEAEAEVEESGTRLSFGASTGGRLRASASSVSLSGSTRTRTSQQLTGPTSAPVSSASSSGVDLHRDPRLITVSSHVPPVSHSHGTFSAIAA
ncbi:hypothetical protein A1O7_09725 [Cladophialophora yegresii CBS 114405]|uniref:Uncharacterized protein n=1 Tax=Cladophialophora yegresii CBS 114405 TaxID=1182544 RepID=W9VQJ0_9EURO|nr:uncharacterized protein A1O7_09725 [Cladophialophora yegresii CBS 114405]EXJ54386.1 hypothetical protein A1O7_09725 [Cladophialophora yegresii CBS 114405]